MSEFRVLLSAALLSAGVAAAVSAATLRFAADGITANRAPPIAAVRLDELAAAYAEEAVRSSGTERETAAAVRAWALALEDALSRVAQRRGVVLLPARAVAAGAPDLTAQVSIEIEAALAGGIRSPAVPPDGESLP